MFTLVFEFVHAGAPVPLQSLSHIAFVVVVAGMCRMKLSLPASDILNAGSSVLPRSCTHMGSLLLMPDGISLSFLFSIRSSSHLDLFLMSLDYAIADAFLFLQRASRTESLAFIVGMAQLNLLLLVPDRVGFSAPMLPRTFA
jgi:hypothetical protein